VVVRLGEDEGGRTKCGVEVDEWRAGELVVCVGGGFVLILYYMFGWGPLFLLMLFNNGFFVVGCFLPHIHGNNRDKK